MSWTDVGVNDVGVNDVGVKGVRDAKESPARCRFARWCLVVSVAGVVVVASMEWCPTRHVVGATSPCPVEDSCIPGCNDISSVVPVD